MCAERASERASICGAEGSFEQKASLGSTSTHFFHSHFLPFFTPQRRNRGATCVCLCAALVLLAYWIGLHFSPRVQILECAERKRIGSQGDASKEQIALSVRGTCFIIMNSRRTRPLSCSIWEAVLTFSRKGYSPRAHYLNLVYKALKKTHLEAAFQILSHQPPIYSACQSPF